MAFPLKSHNSSGRDISILCEEADSGVPESGVPPHETLPELLRREILLEPQLREPVLELPFRRALPELLPRETLLEPQFRESIAELPPRGAFPEPHFRESFSNPFHDSLSSGVRFLDPFSEYRPREPLPSLQFREPSTELQPRELLPPLQFRDSSMEPQPRELLPRLPFRGSSAEPHSRELPSELYSGVEGQAQGTPSYPLSRESGSRQPLPRSRNPYLSATSRYHPYHDDATVARRHRTPLSSPRSPPHTPRTPGLVRTDSFGSNHTNGSLSPITPREGPDYCYSTEIHSSLNSMNGNTSVYPDPTQFEHGTRPAPFEAYSKSTNSPLPPYPVLPRNRRRNAYEDSALAEFYMSRNMSKFSPPPAIPVVEDGKPKRYRCRYAEAINCDKTFTTSGHASRHSKIHTNEKGIQCSYEGCGKKFTRGDNMKQHLETHYKDSKRGSGAGSRSGVPSGMGSLRRGSMGHTAGMRKNFTRGRAAALLHDPKAAADRAIARRGGRHGLGRLEPFGSAHAWTPLKSSPLASPTSDTDQSLDMEVRATLARVRAITQTERSGLDTLAAAVASQVREKPEEEVDEETSEKWKGKYRAA